MGTDSRQGSPKVKYENVDLEKFFQVVRVKGGREHSFKLFKRRCYDGGSSPMGRLNAAQKTYRMTPGVRHSGIVN